MVAMVLSEQALEDALLDLSNRSDTSSTHSLAQARLSSPPRKPA